MKKLLPIIIGVVVLAVAAVLYLFVFSGGEKPEIRAPYSPGDYFVTNVAESKRLFKTGIVMILNSNSSDVTATLEQNNTLIRDTIIFVLRSYTEAEITKVGGEEAIRQHLTEALNSQLGFDDPEGARIVDIQFNDYVVQ